MYYRLYRRRHRIYLAVLAFSLIYFLVGHYESKKTIENTKIDQKLVARSRININTYKEPLPCTDCPGENGAGVTLNEEEKKNFDQVYKKEFFNLIASDKISLWRSIPDSRDPLCKTIQYPNDLPTASVVFIFINERWSALLRSVYSIINRSPKHLLKEIILVDDQSSLEELKQKLDDYCEEHFGDIVKILRPSKRLGLIAAKNYGGRHATGDVVVFLDAHIEANQGWLEPILARIKEKRSAVLCPMIDVINDVTMAYNGGGGSYSIGIFTWSLFFKWGSMPQRTRDKMKNHVEPYPSPTMAGGLLAADRNYFFEIGGYDDGMEIWGGENLELSFRTWMCGGSLEFVPCSHVGHIFRSGHPYNMTGEQSKNDPNARNSLRLTEVWMDDYKRLYYMYRKDLIGKDYGDVSTRREIRTKLNCHDFKWFLENVYPEKFILDENVHSYGEVRNVQTRLCFDTLGKDDTNRFGLGVYSCHGQGNQLFSLTTKDEIKREEDICCYGTNEEGSSVMVQKCTGASSQKWKHIKGEQIRHVESGLCIDVTNVKNNEFAVLNKCDPDKQGQKWEFKNYVSVN